MSRPARADHSALLIEEVAKQLLAGHEVHIANACKAIGIAPSLANHYFEDKADLVRSAWLKIVLAFISKDFEQLDKFGQSADWNGVGEFVAKVFSSERTKVRKAHIRGLAAGSRDESLARSIQAAQIQTTEKWLWLLENYASVGVLDPKVDLKALAIMFTALPIGVTAVQGDLSESDRKAMAETWVTMLRAVL